MKRYFLDCGCNVGQSTKYFINKEVITKDTIVHLFEPNELSINLAKENLQQYYEYNFTFHQVAIWKENCFRKLTIEYSPEDYKCQLSNDIIKGANNAGGATNIMESMWKKPNYIADNHMTDGGLVECIDFSEFLKNNIEKNSEVICKMDIEGAEFEVLDKIINDKTVKLIDILYIEWHSHLLNGEYNVNIIIEKLQSMGVNVDGWV
jgi:FkbM family methyltransferase